MRPLGKNTIASPRMFAGDVFPTNWGTEDCMFDMMLTGFPVCPENAVGNIALLTRRSVYTFSDEELAALLSKPVVVNFDALAPLASRGINLGVSALPRAGGMERFDGKTYWHFRGVPLDVKANDAKILSEFVCGGKSYAAMCIVKTPSGAPALIVGGNGFAANPTHYKRQIMLDALDKIAPLPVRLETTWRASVFPRVDDGGKVCAVTVFNFSRADA